MSAWRRWCARWSGAEAALVVASGALAAGLLAVALARESVGVARLAAFRAWQMSDAWSSVHAEPDERERKQPSRALGPK